MSIDQKQAFPHYPAAQYEPGMTLRDYFAAKAMQALIAKHGGYSDDLSHPQAIRGYSEDAPDVDNVAEYAYCQADAMLKAREDSN
jgi:hypothetical protein